MKLVALSMGAFAVVDDSDYALVSEYSWSVATSSSLYAVTDIDGVKISMHRMIMSPGAADVVDHVNGMTLDNRRENLRVCSVGENVRNRRKGHYRGHTCSSSRFKGVSRATRPPKSPTSPRWRAYIHTGGRDISLGMFTSEIDAARAYDTAAKQFFGPFARLNFPNEHQHQSPSQSSIAKDPNRCLPEPGKFFP